MLTPRRIRIATSGIEGIGALLPGYVPDVPFKNAVEAFLRSRRAIDCSPKTLRIYTDNLIRFQKVVGATVLGGIDRIAVEKYLITLQAKMKKISVHQHYRTLRTFFRWCVSVGHLQAADNPMNEIKMKVPKTLPNVPSDEDVRRLLTACADTFEGWRNRALVHVLADSGLRISEALNIRIENVNFADGSFVIRQGKGRKDRVAEFGTKTAWALRRWLGMRKDLASQGYLFTDRGGRPLDRSYGTHILHKLSKRAGIAKQDDNGKWHGLIGPHALRHYAATAIWERTGDLALVQQVLGHETLQMSLRYTRLARPEIARKFKRASPMDNLDDGTKR